MADESKIFPPSDHKLQELRRAGIVPQSEDVRHFAAFLAAAAVLIWISGAAVELTDLCAKSFSGGVSAEGQAGFLFRLLLGSLGFIAGAILLAGLIQTRFLFRFRVIQPRLQDRETRRTPEGAGRFSVTVLRFLKGAAWVAVAALTMASLFEEFVRQSPDRALASIFGFPEGGSGSALLLGSDFAWTTVAAKRFAMALFAFSGFLAMASWFTAVWAFRYAHRMSRAEVEAEAREQEVRPEVRAARAGFYRESPK